MNREQVIEMAREAGGGLSCIAEPLEHPWKFSESELIRFAALVAAAEREACAKVAETNAADEPYGHAKFRCHNIADAIRARGEK